ncbi:predicted protein [Arabidopsis lyrata subsp. lyrata]|uniref:Predicted protein n=1 Tax=Arabidopsis lyrata subsp. lyrata TaxID=81972 RepID=D7LI63_ARALL|nr:predicted protein [Arabidopsis lyrata subsp. lyrata]
MQMLNEILIDYYQNTKQEQLKRTVDEMHLNQKATVTKQSEGIKRRKRKVKEHMIVQEPKQEDVKQHRSFGEAFVAAVLFLAAGYFFRSEIPVVHRRVSPHVAVFLLWHGLFDEPLDPTGVSFGGKPRGLCWRSGLFVAVRDVVVCCWWWSTSLLHWWAVEGGSFLSHGYGFPVTIFLRPFASSSVALRWSFVVLGVVGVGSFCVGELLGALARFAEG